MTSEASDGGKLLRPKRRRWLWAGAAAALLAPFAAIFGMAATSPDENIALGRNRIVQAPSGERIWLGTFWNHSDSLYTRLDAVV